MSYKLNREWLQFIFRINPLIGPWVASEVDFFEFCWLEQHVERIGAESGTSIEPI